MPMYEYKCEACGHRLEAIQKFSDKPLKLCPKCKKPKLERLLSSSAIQFKGSGWYVTDYAGKSSGGDSAKAEAGKAGGDGSVTAKEGQSDSKKESPAPSTTSETAKPAKESSSSPASSRK